MKLKLYEPNGSQILNFSHLSALDDVLVRKRLTLLSEPGIDPRYGRIVEDSSGREMEVRHSSFRGPYRLIRLKWKGHREVLQTLACYDRRNRTQFLRACAKADAELARIAGLVRKQHKPTRQLHATIGFDVPHESARAFGPIAVGDKAIKVYSTSPVFWAICKTADGDYRIDMATLHGTGDGHAVTTRAAANFVSHTAHPTVLLKLLREFEWHDLAVELEQVLQENKHEPETRKKSRSR